MTIQSTTDKLRELRLSTMAGAFEDQCRAGGLQGLSFEDRFGILVDRWIYQCAESACPVFWKSPVRKEEITVPDR